MSSKNTLGAQDETREIAAGALEHDDREGGDNTVAQKLSNELDNWRRQRGGSRPKRPEAGNGSNPQSSSGPARTIKVRGHETLVVRRPPKLPPKPEADSAPDKT
jgi:hypothetical protein